MFVDAAAANPPPSQCCLVPTLLVWSIVVTCLFAELTTLLGYMITLPLYLGHFFQKLLLVIVLVVFSCGIFSELVPTSTSNNTS